MKPLFGLLKSGTSYMFKKQLFVTNVGISFGLSGFGDILQQKYESLDKKEGLQLHQDFSPKYKFLENLEVKYPNINLSRTFHMSFCFGLTSGFLCHFWYNVLDKLVPGSGIRNVCKKILWDQLLFSPICIGSCLLVAGVVEQQEREKLKSDVIEQGCELYVAEWLLWPPAQFVNFYFLPTRYRVAYDNFISLIYDVYTSHVKHKPRAKNDLC